VAVSKYFKKMYMSNLEATSLIKEALNGFITNFPKTRVRYEFDINANVHCIEIVPNHIYHLIHRRLLI
jgi:hypothetical protein